VRVSSSLYNFAKKIAYACPPLLFCYRKLIPLLSFSRKIVIYTSLRIPKVSESTKTKLVNQRLKETRLAVILKSLFTDEDKGKRYLFSLPAKVLSDYTSVLIELEKLQINKIKKSLKAGRKTVAIHFPSPAYRENVGNIGSKLREKGYNVFFIIGTICNDQYEQQPNVCYLSSKKSLDSLDFVDVFISVTLSDAFPVKAKKIIFLHDIHDSPLGDIDKFLRLALKYHYFVVASEYIAARQRDVFSRAASKDHDVCLLKAGYIKLDRNISHFKEIGASNKALIYAPTITGLDFGDLVSLPKYGEKIVEALLNNFPNYEVIFRPHPHSLRTEEVKNLVQRFTGQPRFIFDDNGSFYMGNYAKSALMVTDMSGTAYSYTFSTLRPVVFFSHDEAEVLRRFGSYPYFLDRSKVGGISENIEDMVEKIRLLLKAGDDFGAEIRKYRDSFIYNVGKSEDYFADNFEYIIKDKRHPDWEYI